MKRLKPLYNKWFLLAILRILAFTGSSVQSGFVYIKIEFDEKGLGNAEIKLLVKSYNNPVKN